MLDMTRPKLLESIFGEDFEKLKGQTLRMTRVRVPGTEICMAHIINPNNRSVYENLGLHIGVHEGEDHMGDTIGLIDFTPWEAVIVAADVALKAAKVEIGFMDRFNGTLIITGSMSQVETAVNEVVRMFRDELHFPACEIYKN